LNATVAAEKQGLDAEAIRDVFRVELTNLVAVVVRLETSQQDVIGRQLMANARLTDCLELLKSINNSTTMVAGKYLLDHGQVKKLDELVRLLGRDAAYLDARVDQAATNVLIAEVDDIAPATKPVFTERVKNWVADKCEAVALKTKSSCEATMETAKTITSVVKALRKIRLFWAILTMILISMIAILAWFARHRTAITVQAEAKNQIGLNYETGEGFKKEGDDVKLVSTTKDPRHEWFNHAYRVILSVAVSTVGIFLGFKYGFLKGSQYLNALRSWTKIIKDLGGLVDLTEFIAELEL